MQNIDEEWRDIRDWEGFYQVSSHGRVRSVPRSQIRRAKQGYLTTFRYQGRVLSPGVNDRGYLVVILADTLNGRRETKKVHRLVCETFIGPPPSGHEVAHNDNNKFNNVPANLRWSTHYDNIQDLVRARAAMACEGV